MSSILTMPTKLDILKVFELKGSLTPTYLANMLGIKQNYARQIILRLKRHGLIFQLPAFASANTYSLTGKGEAKIKFLAEKKEREDIEKRKQTGMYLYQAIVSGLPKEIEKRILNEFNIPIGQLGSKKLDEVALPQNIMQETGLEKLSKESTLANLVLTFSVWMMVLENMTKPTPKPQHLSVEEMVIISSLTKKGSGQYFVTEDGEIVYAPGEGYLTLEAATVLSDQRKAKRTR